MNNWDAPNPPNPPYNQSDQQGYAPPPPNQQQYQPYQGYSPYQQPGQGYGPRYAPPSFLSSMSPQDRATLAIVLEAVCGLFGVMGVGWLISGRTSTGVILLAGYLGWLAVATLLFILTFGLFVVCFAPIHLAVVAVSTVMLYNHLKPQIPTSAPH
ncbi:MAG: hypothetical protein ABI068_06520 [Ktedonobacterales bacterium]